MFQNQFFKKLKKDKCIFAESLSICEDDLN